MLNGSSVGCVADERNGRVSEANATDGDGGGSGQWDMWRAQHSFSHFMRAGEMRFEFHSLSESDFQALDNTILTNLATD